MMTTKTIRILVVDDDDDIRANISDILAEFGYETETAPDGNSALHKIAGTRCVDPCSFDLCLLDFKMPGMDGAELFQLIRQKCPDVKAIMITAFAGDDGIQKAVDAGTWKVLRKPVDVRSLLGLIEQATR